MRVRVGALLVCGVAAGCAAHRSPDAGGPLVHRRSQATYHDDATFDVPSTKSDPAAAQPAAAPAPAAAVVPQKKDSDGPTIESTDAGLGAALLALKTQPTADAYVAVATAYQRLGVLDEAEAKYQQALRLNPAHPAALDGLARVWRDWGLPQEGLPYATRAVARAPRSAPAENTLGTLLFAMGDPTAAKLHFEKAVTLEPTAAYALNNLCYVAFMLGDSQTATTRCAEALDVRPGMTTARNNLALVYAAEGHPERAAIEFARTNESGAVAFNMGIVHMANRDYGAAIPPFDSACHVTPTIPGACAWAAEARRLALAAKR